MRIGTFSPARLPHSANIYIEYITRELEYLNIQIIRFSEKESLPDNVDIYWDPRSMGGVHPYLPLKETNKPVIVTVHGAGPFSLSAREYYTDFRHALLGKLSSSRNLCKWKFFNDRLVTIITVSEYAKKEINKKLYINNDKIVPIYHGIDHSIFRFSLDKENNEKFLLHISQYQPKKNVERLFLAYKNVSSVDKPKLVAVIPDYCKPSISSDIEIINSPMNHEQLVRLYNNALGFIFPSLHETFGMPILEAMACGCPVITSNVCACPEVAGDAALLVNPRSVEDIASAILRLVSDVELRKSLREKGLKRSKKFSWEKSAEEHFKVFNEVLTKA